MLIEGTEMPCHLISCLCHPSPLPAIIVQADELSCVAIRISVSLYNDQNPFKIPTPSPNSEGCVPVSQRLALSKR